MRSDAVGTEGKQAMSTGTMRSEIAGSVSLLVCAVTASVAPSWAGQLVPHDAKVEVLTDQVDFAEGAAAAPDGIIYFSDIPAGKKPGRILQFHPRTRQITVFQDDSHKSNGLYVDDTGQLVACEGADFGGRRIARYRLDGKFEVVAETFRGKRFRAPNDVCVDQRGRIWFTDPHYVGSEPIEIAEKGVYRIDPDGTVHRVLSQPIIQKPNGIHVSPDQRTLYVADTNNETGPDGKPGNMQLVAFAIRRDGSLENKRVLVDFRPDNGVDGMTMDVHGNVYAAVRSQKDPGIRIYSPTGEELGRIATPSPPTNCVFGRGGEANRLYITMDRGFGRVRLDTIGYHLPSR
jgi:gluconolactonase